VLAFAEHEPIGANGSGWLSDAVFRGSAVVLRSAITRRPEGCEEPAPSGPQIAVVAVLCGPCEGKP
jgi:hypothetical protein